MFLEHLLIELPNHKLPYKFYTRGSVRRESNLIIVQQDATIQFITFL